MNARGVSRACARLVPSLLASCVGGEAIELPPKPAEARLGVLITDDDYQTFVDQGTLSPRPLAEDRAGFVRWYGCDLDTLAIAPADTYVRGDDVLSTSLPPSDASWAFDFAERRFTLVSGDTWPDQKRVRDLAGPPSCVQGEQERQFAMLDNPGNAEIFDYTDASIVMVSRFVPYLLYESGRAVDIDVDYPGLLEDAPRNHATGKIWLITGTSTRVITALETGSVKPESSASRVRWETSGAPIEMTLPFDRFGEVVVYGAVEPIVCVRSSSNVSCKGGSYEEHLDGTSASLISTELGIFRMVDGVVHWLRDDPLRVEGVDLPPVRALIADGDNRPWAATTAGELWSLGESPEHHPEYPTLETSYKYIAIGSFGVITTGAVGVKWYRPAGLGPCSDFPFFTAEILSAGNVTILPEIDRERVTWVHPIGRELSDPRQSCPLTIPR